MEARSRLLNQITQITRYLVNLLKAFLSKRLLFMVVSLPLTFGILVWLVWRQREILFAYSWKFHPIPAVLSFGLYTLILFLTAWVWFRIMLAFGSRNLRFWKHFRIFCISALGKRLPGTVWYIAWRAQIYKQDGDSSRLVSLSSGVEAAVSTLSAAILSLIFAIPIMVQNQLSLWGLVLMLFITLVMIQPPVIRWFRDRLGLEKELFNQKKLIVWVLIYVAIRILVGMLFFEIANILSPISINHLPYMIGSQALVACLSMFLFFLPSNFGFAEVSLVLLMSSILPSSVAVVVVLFYRILLIFFELVWASVSVIVERAIMKQSL